MNDVSYQKADEIYKSLCRARSELVTELKELIAEYLKHRNKANSHVAGRDILGEWTLGKDFSTACNDCSSQVFGIIFKEICEANGWRLVDRDKKLGSKGKTYEK